MKRIRHMAAGLFFSAVFFVVWFAGVTFGAESNYAFVYDSAGLFSEEESKALSEAAKGFREQTGMEAAVVTTEENPSSAREYADQFYQDAGLGTGKDYSGVLLLLDMDNREIYISTSGDMLWYLSDSRLEAVLDDIYGFMAEGEYGSAAMVFFEDVSQCVENGIGKDPYLYDTETGKVTKRRRITWYEVLFAFVIASSCGAAAAASVVRDYGNRREDARMAANFKLSYRKDSAYRPGALVQDVLLRTHVTKQLLRAASGGGRGGSSGTRSGGGASLSGGGRTSTHTHRGRTHGGGGRKF